MGGKIRSFLHMFLRKIIFVICLIIFPSDLIFAQAWQWQNPLPQGNRLDEIQFIDSQNGWIISEDGTTLFRTTDAGATWNLHLTGKKWTNKVFFIDSVNGWGVGSGEPPLYYQNFRRWEILGRFANTGRIV